MSSFEGSSNEVYLGIDWNRSHVQITRLIQGHDFQQARAWSTLAVDLPDVRILPLLAMHLPVEDVARVALSYTDTQMHVGVDTAEAEAEAEAATVEASSHSRRLDAPWSDAPATHTAYCTMIQGIARDAIAHWGLAPDTVLNVCASVPNDLNDKARTTLFDRLNGCGFKVLRIINRAVAACSAYGLNETLHEGEMHVLVVDNGVVPPMQVHVLIDDRVYEIRQTTQTTTYSMRLPIDMFHAIIDIESDSVSLLGSDTRRLTSIAPHAVVGHGVAITANIHERSISCRDTWPLSTGLDMYPARPPQSGQSLSVRTGVHFLTRIVPRFTLLPHTSTHLFQTALPASQQRTAILEVLAGEGAWPHTCRSAVRHTLALPTLTHHAQAQPILSLTVSIAANQRVTCTVAWLDEPTIIHTLSPFQAQVNSLTDLSHQQQQQQQQHGDETHIACAIHTPDALLSALMPISHLHG
jgi:hypothetical protein